MQDLLNFSPKERQQAFEEASARSKIIKNPVIVEKDFWVCWTLDQIFSNKDLSPHVIFKGGTSLSKCYNIIERFSEDIDLTFSKEYMGINDENDPASCNTRKQRDKRLEELSKKVQNKINEEIKPILQNEFSKNLYEYFDQSAWRLELDENDKQSLIFHYPNSIPKKDNDYIQSAIKLEFGARGGISPSENKNITAYYHELLPELGGKAPEITVCTLLAKRTYWEKITLLHAEYHRSPNKQLPYRLFRHYYDIVMLDHNNLTQEALQDIELLEDVKRNKSIYFPAKWANYDEAVIGSLCLYPNKLFINQLKADHGKMLDMFFGSAPDFDETLEHIKRIEKIINKSK